MSTLEHNEPDDKKILGSHGPSEIDASAGYEQTDVKVTGIVVFLTALAIFVAVAGILSWGIGKVINAILVGKIHSEDKHPISRILMRLYEPVVAWSLRWKWFVIARALGC